MLSNFWQSCKPPISRIRKVQHGHIASYLRHKQPKQLCKSTWNVPHVQYCNSKAQESTWDTNSSPLQRNISRKYFFYLLGMLTGRRYCERPRQGYCFGGSRAKFTKFSHKNCAKIVLIQVSWHAKSWVKFPSEMWVRSLNSMDSWGTMRLEC